MTNTNNLNEADHNRDAGQRFADKKQTEPGIAAFTAPRARKPGEYGGYQL
jgi:hypothetical protein